MSYATWGTIFVNISGHGDHVDEKKKDCAKEYYHGYFFIYIEV